MVNIVTWTYVGKEETKTDKLRSILSQMEFTMTIKDWERKGVNFRSHLYVPERHPLTGEVFCDMEDEGHVFKVSLNTVHCAFYIFTEHCLLIL